MSESDNWQKTSADRERERIARARQLREANDSVARSYGLRPGDSARSVGKPAGITSTSGAVVQCLRHPEYRGIGAPIQSCVTCCMIKQDRGE
jgi:hypothetical protein